MSIPEWIGRAMLAVLGINDSVSGAQVNIDSAHAQVHEGESYVATDIVTLADAGTREYLVTTADSAKLPNMIFNLSGSLDTKVEIFIDTEKTGGTAVPSFNNDHNQLAEAAETTVTHTPDGAGDGTRVWAGHGGNDSGQGNQAGGSGGGGRGTRERILKRNTKYLVRFTSASDVNNLTAEFDWYEHTPAPAA